MRKSMMMTATRTMAIAIALVVMQSAGLANWTRYSGNPVVTGVSPVGCPVVIEDAGVYKMWYQNDFGVWYATSPNGLDWTPYGTGAVFNVGQMNLGTVRYDGSGTYQMWYGTGGASGQTGYATSPDGISWADHGYVLMPGPDTFDAYAAGSPFVMLDGHAGLYKMWYTAGASTSVGRTVAYATSVDGLSWTKHGVVFEPQGGSWYSWSTGSPYVEKGAAGYTMWFGGGDGTTGNIGRAFSSDGINWDYSSVTLELSPVGWENSVVGNPWILSTSDGRTLMYYAGGATLSTNTTGIGVAAVPAPGAFLLGLLGTGLLGLRSCRRR